MKSSLCNIALVGLFCMMAASPAWSQAATASVTGTVTDPTGAVVPGATVTITSKATGAIRTASTDAVGKYLIVQLAPATYRVEIKMSGFKTAVRENVELLVGITSTLDVELEVGAVAEEVVVEGTVTGINSVDATKGSAFSGSEVAGLPVLDLNPVGLLGLQAGVTYVPGSTLSAGGYGGVSNDDARGGSVNGSRSDQTNVTLDGVDVNDIQFGFAFHSVLRSTQASLQEFRTVTSNSNADAGRSSAAQVILVTKSGTNDIHGQAYWAHRNEAFNANDFFLNSDNVKEGEFRRHIYGAALGGPIVKDRFFLFGNYERLEETLFRSAERDIPSLSMRDGVYIFECQNPAACPGNTVAGVSGATYTADPGFNALSPADLTALDPLGWPTRDAILAEFQNFPVPNSSGTFDALNIVGFRFAAPIQNTFNTYIARADINIDPAGRHQVFWRGTLHDDVNVSTPQFPGLAPINSLLNSNRGFALGYNATLGPNVVNTFRWGYTRIKEVEAGLATGEFVDFRFIDDSRGLETESIGGTNNSQGRTIPVQHVRNDTSWRVGRHSLSFGGEVRYTRNSKFSTANSFHLFQLNPSWLSPGGRSVEPGRPECAIVAVCTALPAVDSGSNYRDGVIELLGVISNPSAFYNFDRTGATLSPGTPVARRFAVDEYEVYLQDQWRATPNLTFTFGARFQVASPPWETDGNQVSPNPGLQEWFNLRRTLMENGLPTLLAGDLTFRLGGKANNAPGFYPWDWNNWSPRISVAWSPQGLGWLSGNGKMVIRGGYALVYDRIGNALATTFDEGGSFGMSTNLDAVFGGCDTGWDPSKPDCARFSGVFDVAPATAISLPPSPGGGFPATPPRGFTFISPALNDSIQTPYSHTFNLSIGRELPWGIVVEGAYVGRRSRKLLMIEDLAMPADLVDQASGISAFQAARQLVGLSEAGQDLLTLGPLPFWENLFPSFGPAGINGGCLPFDVFGVDPGSACGFSPSQVAYDYVIGWHGTDTTGAGFGAVTTWWEIDNFGFPGYMLGGAGDPDIDGDGLPDAQFAFFPSQYGDLQAWGSVAKSEYHAFQLTVRKRLSHGVLFNLNYTLSHSLDHGSSPERADAFSPAGSGPGYSGSTINTWDLDLEYATSDFDMRHQFNSSWVVEMPFGQGRAFASNTGWANQILGGWQISGILRLNSGLPLGIVNPRSWPTNWDLQGNAFCKPASASVFGLTTGPCPATQNVKNAAGDRGPNIFADPDAAFDLFRVGAPGERGLRNNLRADNYFNLDLGIGKSFNMPWEGHSFKFRWDMFNLTNSVYFDGLTMNGSLGTRGTFGNYNDVLGGPRRGQVSLQYQF